MRRVAEDLENNLYESFHVNFVEPLPRALLEELAAAVAKDGTSDLVEQVWFHRQYAVSSLEGLTIFLRLQINIFHSFRLPPRCSLFFLHLRKRLRNLLARLQQLHHFRLSQLLIPFSILLYHRIRRLKMRQSA